MASTNEDAHPVGMVTRPVMVLFAEGGRSVVEHEWRGRISAVTREMIFQPF